MVTYLKELQVASELTAVDVGVAGLDGLEQRVVDKDVLLFRLNEEVALIADMAKKAAHIQLVLHFNLLEHGVEDDVGARPTDSGAAVDDDGSGSDGVGRCRLSHEAEDGQRVFGSAVIRPIGIMELNDGPFRALRLFLLQLGRKEENQS